MPAQQELDWNAFYLNAATGLLVFRPGGEIVVINNTLRNWLGIDETTKIENFLDLLSKGSRLYYSLFIVPILSIDAQVSEISLTLLTPSGELPVLFNASSTEVGSSEILINAALFRVKERKKFEAELMREKEQAREETNLRNEALHKIANNYAHQLRAPLSNIIGLIDLLAAQNTDRENDEIINMIQFSAAALDTTTKMIINQSTVKP